MWIRIQRLKIMWICNHASNKPKIKSDVFKEKGALLLFYSTTLLLFTSVFKVRIVSTVYFEGIILESP
jgi:hypothetical protein